MCHSPTAYYISGPSLSPGPWHTHKQALIHTRTLSGLPSPQVFAGLLVGAMLPYWFSAMTMKSVGKAALSMVEEVGCRVSILVEIS